MAYLRIPFCSPYKLFWPLLRKSSFPSDEIHHAYARYVWSMHGIRAVPRVLAYSVFWPLAFAYLSLKHTSKLGRKVKQVTGKNSLRQVAEQFRVALRYSISPKKYYVFELFRPGRLRNARHYIARYEFKGGLHNLLESRIENPTRNLLNDKAAFFAHCEGRGIATVPTFLVVCADGATERLLPFSGLLPECDLFVKPFRGRGGRGCERWHFQRDGSYRDQNGTILSAEALLSRLVDLAALQKPESHKMESKKMLVQEVMRAHEDLRDLALNVLTSCRIMSVKNERGGFEATHAVFKSSTKPEAIVDNFHKGGIVSRVDMRTGELGPASDAGVGEPCVWYEKHPLTQAQIAGRRLPLWRETIDLVCRAHAAFPDRITVGWDVAITERGPTIIEGNVQSGCDMIQRTHDLPAGIGRFAECYAYHVRAALKQDVSTAWKIRKGLNQSDGQVSILRFLAAFWYGMRGFEILRGKMSLFWTAWTLAWLLIVASVGATAWVYSAPHDWPPYVLAAARAFCLVFLLAGFVGAFRLALLATSTLRVVLAQNLAALIVLELDDLRRAARERATFLASEAGTEPYKMHPDAWQSPEVLQIPRFFGGREEIRKLLGETTEHKLEQVLISLNSYNETVAEARSESSKEPGARRNAVLQLGYLIGEIENRIRQAASAVAPFCHVS